jgi:amidase
MTSDLISTDAVTLAAMLGRRDVSAVEVVAAHLDRIEQVNADVNAIVAMFEHDEILAAARRADDDGPSGPLHGLPVAVKDLEDVAGLPTRCGSPLTSSRPARADGLIAARLRTAGAIIIGKTNTPEFGAGSHTFNELHGLTRNPWDLSRSAGGSSGGAAAALAAGMVPIADGGDLGGSLRNPAGFCNVVGLRPTIGRVPVPDAGAEMIERLSVRGPMGRTVADTALVLSVLAGPHPDDPLALPERGAPFREPLPTTTSARVGWAGDLGLFPCEPDVLERCVATARSINDVGGTFTEAIPDLAGAMEAFRIGRGLIYRNLAMMPEERWRSLKPSLVANIEFGLALDDDDIARGEAIRGDVVRSMASFFEHHDVLALPSAQVAPFPAEWEYPTEIDGTSMGDYLDWMTTCCIITVTGCPAMSIQAGFTDEGLPVGLQLVAPRGAERRLLEVAAAIESSRPAAGVALLDGRYRDGPAS